jgi:hypothetical protein
VRQPNPLRLIAFVANVLPPRPVFQIPRHGFRQSGFEGLCRAPAQFVLDLCRIDTVAPVVPGAIFDKGII